MSKKIIVDIEPGYSYEGSSRFNGAIRRAGMGMGTVQLPIYNWVADGGTTPTLTKDVGTDGKSQTTKMVFAHTQDDIAFTTFTVPLDYNKTRAEMWFVGAFDSSNHDNGEYAHWKLEGRVIPLETSIGSLDDPAAAVAIDASFTSIGSANIYTDDTTMQVKAFKFNICDGITPNPGDMVCLSLDVGSGASSLTGAVNLVNAAVHYSR